tara:strand:- start:5749 stop:5958 length:210 start_codon:yes stop_codon:yes gene_type:complete
MFDISNLFIGILLVVVGIMLFVFENDRYKKLRKDQYIQKSFFTNTFVMVYIMELIGVVMFFKEIFKLLV